MLTLFPIHALGLRTIAAANKKKKKKKKKQQNDADTEFVAYDSDRDGKYFASDNQEAGLRMKLNIPLDSSQPALSVLGGDRRNKVLFARLTGMRSYQGGWVLESNLHSMESIVS